MFLPPAFPTCCSCEGVDDRHTLRVILLQSYGLDFARTWPTSSQPHTAWSSRRQLSPLSHVRDPRAQGSMSASPLLCRAGQVQRSSCFVTCQCAASLLPVCCYPLRRRRSRFLPTPSGIGVFTLHTLPRPPPCGGHISLSLLSIHPAGDCRFCLRTCARLKEHIMSSSPSAHESESRLSVNVMYVSHKACRLVRERKSLPRADSPSHYDLTIRTDLRELTFSGTAEITVTISKTVPHIVLHATSPLVLEAAVLGTVDASGAARAAEHIHVDEKTLRACIRFKGGQVEAGQYKLGLRWRGSLDGMCPAAHLSKNRAPTGLTLATQTPCPAIIGQVRRAKTARASFTLASRSSNLVSPTCSSSDQRIQAH